MNNILTPNPLKLCFLELFKLLIPGKKITFFNPLIMKKLANHFLQPTSNYTLGIVLIIHFNFKETRKPKNSFNHSIENQKVKYKQPKVNLDVYL